MTNDTRTSKDQLNLLPTRLRIKASKGGIIPIHDVTLTDAADEIEHLHLAAANWQHIARERTADLGKADEKIERLQRELAESQYLLNAYRGEMSAEVTASEPCNEPVAWRIFMCYPYAQGRWVFSEHAPAVPGSDWQPLYARYATEPGNALSVLQAVSSWLGAGGIDSSDPVGLEKRIRWGIDHHVNVALERAALAIEPSEVTTLFDKDFETKRDVREARARRRLADEVRALKDGSTAQPPRECPHTKDGKHETHDGGPDCRYCDGTAQPPPTDQVAAAAARVANEIGLFDEEDPFKDDLRVLIAAVRASQPPKLCQRFRVLAITTAYESGFGHGKELDELPNPYSEGGDEHEAYSIGYEQGEIRRRRNGSSGYCNQRAHDICTNKECMCKCHTPTKPETHIFCMGCKQPVPEEHECPSPGEGENHG